MLDVDRKNRHSLMQRRQIDVYRVNRLDIAIYTIKNINDASRYRWSDCNKDNCHFHNVDYIIDKLVILIKSQIVVIRWPNVGLWVGHECFAVDVVTIKNPVPSYLAGDDFPSVVCRSVCLSIVRLYVWTFHVFEIYLEHLVQFKPK